MQSFRRLRIVLSSALIAFLAPATAQADLWGADLGPLNAILTESIAQGVMLGSQLAQLIQQVQLMQTMLSNLDPQSFTVLSNLISTTSLTYEKLVGDVDSIGYTMDSVNREYKSTFPTKFSSTRPRDFNAMYTKWQNEIWGSAFVAVRAQTVLSNLHRSASSAADILSRSEAAPGTVAQLQAVVQMLGLIHSQIGSLVQSLTTTGRVIATTASAETSQRQLSRERTKRNLADYTKRGASVTVSTRLP